MNKLSFTSCPGATLAAAGIALAATIGAAPAQAFTVTIDPSFGSTENTGSTALLDFNFTQQGNNTLLNLFIQNTTVASIPSTLVGVAFDTPNGISQSSYSANGSSFFRLFNDQSLNPYGSFDIGIRSGATGGGLNGGNPQTGLTNGQAATALFTFNGQNAASLETAFFNLFSQPQPGNTAYVAARFQQVGENRNDSDKVKGGVTTAAAVPEPTTMAGLALAGAGLLGRKKLQRKKVSA